MLKQLNGGRKPLTNSMPLVASLWDHVTKGEKAFRVTKSRLPSGLEKLLTNSMQMVASLWDHVMKRERAFHVTKSRLPSGLEKLPS
jgi:hypothetical protein